MIFIWRSIFYFRLSHCNVFSQHFPKLQAVCNEIARFTQQHVFNTPLHCLFYHFTKSLLTVHLNSIVTLHFALFRRFFVFHFVLLLYQLLQQCYAFIAIFFRKPLDERASLNEFSRILFSANKSASPFY